MEGAVLKQSTERYASNFNYLVIITKYLRVKANLTRTVAIQHSIAHTRDVDQRPPTGVLTPTRIDKFSHAH